MVPAVEVAMRAMRIQDTVAWFGRMHPQPTAVGRGDQAFVVERALRAVERVRRNSPFPGKCLSRSITLWSLLREEGLAAEIRIGVRKRGSELEAHAWVELDGRILNDTQDVGTRFRPFQESLVP